MPIVYAAAIGFGLGFIKGVETSEAMKWAAVAAAAVGVWRLTNVR